MRARPSRRGGGRRLWRSPRSIGGDRPRRPPLFRRAVKRKGALALAEASSTAAAERASGSSFYNAMRILPRAQREAMFQIYSFCRQVDDIADSTGPRDERRAELDRWRVDIDALYAGKPVARTQGMVAPLREFGMRREDFHAIIDGMEMDVIADIVAPDDAALESYCDRVASAVGRLSV